MVKLIFAAASLTMKNNSLKTFKARGFVTQTYFQPISANPNYGTIRESLFKH